MEYKSLKDFIARTNENLEVIEGLKLNDFEQEVYETTQLINSLLGLIVIPKEEHVNDIPTTPLVDLVKQGWSIPGLIVHHPKTPDLRSLIHYMRNAVAHFNIKFIGDSSDGTIIGVELWNENRAGKINWKVDLLLVELRDITKRFSHLMVTQVLK